MQLVFKHVHTRLAAAYVSHASRSPAKLPADMHLQLL